MNFPVTKALLPSGMRDLLPPDAEHEARLIETVIGTFTAHGYDRVQPPLIESADALLVGPGEALTAQAFRLPDPLSNRMLAIRPDMTLQVARIAVTRLGRAPRPLRLCYAGQVLRTAAAATRSERQFGQVGAELIGPDLATADAEVILMAVRALRLVGICQLSVDLCVPALAGELLATGDLDGEQRLQLRQAIDHKDRAGVTAIGGHTAALTGRLMDCTGPAATALHQLASIELPASAAAIRSRLTEVAALVADSDIQDLILTVDTVERRGFEYYTGVGFTVFARDQPIELGGGGRYLAPPALNLPQGKYEKGEAATGVTLYTDALAGAAKHLDESPRLYVPFGTQEWEAEAFRCQGWRTVMALCPEEEPAATARHLGCTHIAGPNGSTCLFE